LSVLDRIRRFFLRCRRDRSTLNPERPDIGMDSEVDYFALAHLLIDEYGTDAGAHAGRLKQEAEREADPEAAADWRAVAQAITLLNNNSAATMH
jgi:hypothetical protein